MPCSGTLTKTHIVNSVTEANGYSCRISVETIETLLELIKSKLESGGDIMISGFGRICVKQMQKTAANPTKRDNLRPQATRVR